MKNRTIESGEKTPLRSPLKKIEITFDSKNNTTEMVISCTQAGDFIEQLFARPSSNSLYVYKINDADEIKIISQVLKGQMSTRVAYEGIKNHEFAHGINPGSDTSSAPCIKVLTALSLTREECKYVPEEFFDPTVEFSYSQLNSTGIEQPKIEMENTTRFDFRYF